MHPIIKRYSLEILKSYGSLIFLNSSKLSLPIIIGLCFAPLSFMSGLSAVISTIFIHGLLKNKFTGISYLHLFNAILLGHFLILLGIESNILYSFLLLIGTICTFSVSIIAKNTVLRKHNFAYLYLPFLCGGFIILLILEQHNINSFFNITSLTDSEIHLFRFFEALSSLFLIPNYYVGAFVALSLFIYSRYLFLIAFLTHEICQIILVLLPFELNFLILKFSGISFIIPAIFASISYQDAGVKNLTVSLIFSLIGLSLLILLEEIIITNSFLFVVLPALISCYILQFVKFIIYLKLPDEIKFFVRPEKNLAKSKFANNPFFYKGNFGITLPFMEEWQVCNEIAVKPVRHSLNFNIIKNGKPHKAVGSKLTDYYCYNKPVFSPVAGTILYIEDGLRDNLPSQISSNNRLGNHIIIKLNNNYYLILAHLKHKSIQKKVGDTITTGDYLAHCGNSGRSLQPHLYLEIRKNYDLNSPTIPFYFISFVNKNIFKYRIFPKDKEFIKPIAYDHNISKFLNLEYGNILHIDIKDDIQTVRKRLHIVVNEDGDYQLVSDYGASFIFNEDHGSLLFFKRSGPKDFYFDVIVAALDRIVLDKTISSWSSRAFNETLLRYSFTSNILYFLFFPFFFRAKKTYNKNLKLNNLTIKSESVARFFWFKPLILKSQVNISTRLGIKDINLSLGRRKINVKFLKISKN